MSLATLFQNEQRFVVLDRGQMQVPGYLFQLHHRPNFADEGILIFNGLQIVVERQALIADAELGSARAETCAFERRR